LFLAVFFLTRVSDSIRELSLGKLVTSQSLRNKPAQMLPAVTICPQMIDDGWNSTIVRPIRDLIIFIVCVWRMIDFVQYIYFCKLKLLPDLIPQQGLQGDDLVPGARRQQLYRRHWRIPGAAARTEHSVFLRRGCLNVRQGLSVDEAENEESCLEKQYKGLMIDFSQLGEECHVVE
jgi:hypothetical protein